MSGFYYFTCIQIRGVDKNYIYAKIVSKCCSVCLWPFLGRRVLFYLLVSRDDNSLSNLGTLRGFYGSHLRVRVL